MAGKAVWNTAVTNATTEALQGLLVLLRTNPALVFSRAYFKRMHLEAGADVRLVPTPAFKSACEGACAALPAPANMGGGRAAWPSCLCVA